MSSPEILIAQPASLPGPEEPLLFTLVDAQHVLSLQVYGPEFEVDGRPRRAFHFVRRESDRLLPDRGQEVELEFTDHGQPDLTLKVLLRSYPDAPVIRFRYRLTSALPARLTKPGGVDRLRYFEVACAPRDTALTEVQLSHFDPVIHSYFPHLQTYAPEQLYDGQLFAGPILLGEGRTATWMAGYEHGAEYPDSFLQYRLRIAQDQLCLSLWGCKGGYYHGQPIGPEQSWQSAWVELGVAPGPLAAFLPEYRRFMLNDICDNPETRRPYIFYNTWNYQERNRYFNGRPYLESMTQERILAEIDAAHKIGVDVFVIDTGWYTKTGDWLPDRKRFPDGLQAVRRKLEGYGMQLGLWFNPTAAALSSQVYRAHPEYRMSWRGQLSPQAPVWETEESVFLCLASDFAEDFIETLVRLHAELGVSYFKWDGLGQYGCDSALHHHGRAENSDEERAACYAYQMGEQMIHIAEQVSRRCPGVIVDFDITEGGRFVGLGFLRAGKFFLVNNGPYFSDFDIPRSTRVDPDTINVFFYPGPARARVCRQGARFDRLIPSVLFLTHYLPDAPRLSQHNSLAALALGGNGLWGDLLSLSAEDIEFWSSSLARYKQVAGALTRAYPRTIGQIGSSPEIYEKIDPHTVSGAVIFFTVAPGQFTFVTQPLEAARLKTVTGADAWELIPDGRLKLTVNLERNDARVVFVFGEE